MPPFDSCHSTTEAEKLFCPSFTPLNVSIAEILNLASANNHQSSFCPAKGDLTSNWSWNWERTDFKTSNVECPKTLNVLLGRRFSACIGSMSTGPCSSSNVTNGCSCTSCSVEKTCNSPTLVDGNSKGSRDIEANINRAEIADITPAGRNTNESRTHENGIMDNNSGQSIPVNENQNESLLHDTQACKRDKEESHPVDWNCSGPQSNEVHIAPENHSKFHPIVDETNGFQFREPEIVDTKSEESCSLYKKCNGPLFHDAKAIDRNQEKSQMIENNLNNGGIIPSESLNTRKDDTIVSKENSTPAEGQLEESELEEGEIEGDEIQEGEIPESECQMLTNDRWKQVMHDYDFSAFTHNNCAFREGSNNIKDKNVLHKSQKRKQRKKKNKDMQTANSVNRPAKKKEKDMSRRKIKSQNPNQRSLSNNLKSPAVAISYSKSAKIQTQNLGRLCDSTDNVQLQEKGMDIAQQQEKAMDSGIKVTPETTGPLGTTGYTETRDLASHKMDLGSLSSLLEGNASVCTNQTLDEALESAKEEAAKKKVKQGSITEQRKDKRKATKRKKTALKEEDHGIKRLHLSPVTKPKPKSVCKYYMKGNCGHGSNCTYSHDGVPDTKSQTCKYYINRSCLKGDDCPFSHDRSSIPCKFYHTKHQCSEGDKCRFSHSPIEEHVLQEFMKKWEVEKQDGKQERLLGQSTPGLQNVVSKSPMSKFPIDSIFGQISADTLCTSASQINQKQPPKETTDQLFFENLGNPTWARAQEHNKPIITEQRSQIFRETTISATYTENKDTQNDSLLDVISEARKAGFNGAAAVNKHVANIISDGSLRSSTYLPITNPAVNATNKNQCDNYASISGSNYNNSALYTIETPNQEGSRMRPASIGLLDSSKSAFKVMEDLFANDCLDKTKLSEAAHFLFSKY